ncbi:MAG: UDP-2,3-diacylglucosamine diphosphatase LpxI [Candidatus Omnitrophica bacterium]|nr:UDP-2,3-diacylglucosamine diphosphatase LpxI [Candidatus Omnitrophota bacterium]
MKQIGLIAGNGEFPFIFARAARQKGYEVVAICIREETSPEIETEVARSVWIGLGELAKLLTILKEERIDTLALAGQVRQIHVLRDTTALDAEMRGVLDSLDIRKPTALFERICAKIESLGIRIVNSTTFLDELLPRKGTLTKKGPSDAQWKDIAFGVEVAKELARLDIGLTVVVKRGVIVALEAVEGTNEAIARGGAWGGEGTVVVKVARPDQDMRFDIPVIGPRTIEALRGVRSGVLAVEAGKTLIIDRASCLKEADSAGISVVAL